MWVPVPGNCPDVPDPDIPAIDPTWTLDQPDSSPQIEEL